MKRPIGTRSKKRDFERNSLERSTRRYNRIASAPRTYPIIEGSFTRRAVLYKFPYSVVYSIEDELLLIYAIFHNSRNPMVWRGRIG